MKHYRSREIWNEPDAVGGQRHEKGEVVTLDPENLLTQDDIAARRKKGEDLTKHPGRVFDLPDLLVNGTLEELAEEAAPGIIPLPNADPKASVITMLPLGDPKASIVVPLPNATKPAPAPEPKAGDQ